LLYLVNFAVPNLRLVGLVDAGEGFFLLALLRSLSECELWVLPVIAVLGALTKESFIPFSVVFAHDRNSGRSRSHFPPGTWILISWVLSLAAVIGSLQWSITGTLVSPLQFGLALHHGNNYLGHFTVSWHDRNL
jgi:hypothetical protein